MKQSLTITIAGGMVSLLCVLGISIGGCNHGDDGIPLPWKTKTLTVRVVNEENHNVAAANATVVLGDSTGAMVNWATTDADGLVTFTSPPDDATVTAMTQRVQVPWDPLKWQYSLSAAYDVNVSRITLSLDIIEKIGEANVNVAVGGGFPSVDHWHIYPGWGEGNGTSNPSLINVYQRSIQKVDGLISFVVIGEDLDHNPVAFGSLLDQTFDPEAATPTYNVTINTAFTDFTYNVSNAAAANADYLYSSVGMSEQNTHTISMEKTFGPAETFLTVPALSISGYGDSFTHTVAAGKDLNKGLYGGVLEGFASWLYGASRMTTTALTSPLEVDLDPALYPSVPEGLWLNNAGTERPMLSWTGSDSSADFKEIEINFDTREGQYRYHLLLPATRQNVIFPELPMDVVSDWRDFPPVWLSKFTVGTSSIDDSIIAGYNDYLTKEDKIKSGQMAMPEDITVKISRAEKNFNALLKGEYEISKFYNMAGANGYYSSRIDASFNGDGRMDYTVLEDSFFPGGSDYRTYFLSPYNVVTFLEGSGEEKGVVLPQYGMFVITDTDEARSLTFQVGVKKSTAVTPAFDGEYIMSQIGENAGGLYTSQVKITSYGAGNGVWQILSHSQGVSGNGSFEYTLNPDGTLSLVDMYDDAGGFIGTDHGMVASDVNDPARNMIVLVDASSADGDGDIMLAVGIKKTATAPFFHAASYYTNFFGDESGTTFASRLNVAWDVAHSEFDCTVLSDSRGAPPGTTFSAGVTLSATDNTFQVEGGDYGILSPDGWFFVVVDTNAADGEIKLSVGVGY